MSSLKKILHQDLNKFKQDELVELLTSIADALGTADYAAISGVEPAELAKLEKDEVVAIAQNIRDAYQPDMERIVPNLIGTVVGAALKMEAADAKFVALDNTVSSADFAAELGSIDFEKLIGGPMNAAVNAQTNASLATVNFIKEVGFDRDSTGKVTGLKMADFSFKKSVPDPDDPDNNKVVDIEVKVPFISILSVPSLRIETLDIDFNVKLNSTYSRDVSNSLGVDAEVSGGWGPVKMKVSASYKRSSSTGVKVEKEYSMGVKVRATNDELPAGLEKVLGLMTE